MERAHSQQIQRLQYQVAQAETVTAFVPLDVGRESSVCACADVITWPKQLLCAVQPQTSRQNVDQLTINTTPSTAQGSTEPTTYPLRHHAIGHRAT
ncbi:hypothetical protein [Fischerella sp. PCC 9605]|uniref:hypothetical protein n=1 Tax=Fischerella sp. PCC 9605 TaxID=1173024 RepID=UPI001E529C26|nr:hypothetical protein [Fischerella sp. PCC 9605]